MKKTKKRAKTAREKRVASWAERKAAFYEAYGEPEPEPEPERPSLWSRIKARAAKLFWNVRYWMPELIVNFGHHGIAIDLSGTGLLPSWSSYFGFRWLFVKVY